MPCRFVESSLVLPLPLRLRVQVRLVLVVVVLSPLVLKAPLWRLLLGTKRLWRLRRVERRERGRRRCECGSGSAVVVEVEVEGVRVWVEDSWAE